MADGHPAELPRFLVQLVGLARTTGARFLLVTETEASVSAEHLVDGIVALEQTVQDGARERFLALRKMRGTPLPRPLYLFTLSGGRFSAYTDEPSEDIVPALRPPPRTGANGRLSTAVAEWDHLLQGGLAHGSVHLLEVGHEVGPEHLVLLRPLLLNAINVGVPVLHVGQPNVSVEEFRRTVERHLGPTAAGRAALHPVEAARDDPHPRVVRPRERLAPVERKRREVAEGKPVLSILSEATLSAWADGQSVQDWLTRWCATSRREGHIDVLLVGEGTAAAYAALANDWWRLERRLDALVLHGVQPPTGRHLVRRRNHKGYPEAFLEPIQ